MARPEIIAAQVSLPLGQRELVWNICKAPHLDLRNLNCCDVAIVIT